MEVAGEIISTGFEIGLVLTFIGQRFATHFIKMVWSYFLTLQILLCVEYFGNLMLPVQVKAFVAKVKNTLTGAKVIKTLQNKF